MNHKLEITSELLFINILNFKKSMRYVCHLVSIRTSKEKSQSADADDEAFCLVILNSKARNNKRFYKLQHAFFDISYSLTKPYMTNKFTILKLHKASNIVFTPGHIKQNSCFVLRSKDLRLNRSRS